MTDTFTSPPVSLLSPLCSPPCWLPSALLDDEDDSEPEEELEAVLGNEGDDGDDEELGIEGIEGDEEDDDEELGIDGIELDEEEDEELGGDGIDGDELELDEGDEGLGIDGIELLELELEDGVWQPATISASAEAVSRVPSLGRFAMLMGQSSSPVFQDPCKPWCDFYMHAWPESGAV